MIEDKPGMLRTKLLETQTSSGSGNNYAVVLVVAERAERAAFARTALAVKLRELNEVCDARDKLSAQVDQLSKECREIAIHCERFDADLDVVISGGRLSRAR